MSAYAPPKADLVVHTPTLNRLRPSSPVRQTARQSTANPPAVIMHLFAATQHVQCLGTHSIKDPGTQACPNP
ncbi:hypothetical protein GCM10009780_58320 [Actinomadura alba]